MSEETAKILLMWLIPSFITMLWLVATYKQLRSNRKLAKLQKAVYEERAMLLTSDSKYVREVVSDVVKDYHSKFTTNTGPR